MSKGVPTTLCQCGHPYADHDGNGCGARVEHWDHVGRYYLGCTCTQYEGAA